MALALTLMRFTAPRFVRRLHELNEGWRWRWNSCGLNGGATVFSWIGDTEMRNAVGFEPNACPLVKINAATWDVTELPSIPFWSWRCHILNTRGARETDIEFLRIVWACFGLPTAHDAPQPGELNVHCNEVR